MKKANFSQLLRNPGLTTTWPLNDRADVKITVEKIQKKLFVYGVISDAEKKYLDKYQVDFLLILNNLLISDRFL